MRFVYIPVNGEFAESDIAAMAEALDATEGPALAYCRTGNRSAKLGALALAERVAPEILVAGARRAGYDLAALKSELALRHARHGDIRSFDVVIVGAGAAGIATAASLLRRRQSLNVAIVDSAEHHYYQPGWTMVGAGIFTARSTERRTADLIPTGAQWIRERATGFDPAANLVRIGAGGKLRYGALVVATGLVLDWDAVPGLTQALGQNGVTSNYRYDLAPYTARLVTELKGGRAIFTQPPMPIKCAGAPQKAMYLSCDRWRRAGTLARTSVTFHNANASLFGVADYVPALMEYVSAYGIDLKLSSKLVGVDGPAQVATFERTGADGEVERIAEPFDLLHVCPPQVAPAVVASSPIAGPGGFVEVDPATLAHPLYPDVFAVGDVAGTSNAKTAAAARKMAPVAAVNVLARLDGKAPTAVYDGYGSCPLTVERGRIVLAEFGYGGALTPTFPRWLLDGRKATRLAWQLKSRLLPWLYWNAMLKGREWLATPASVDRAA